MEFAQIRSLPGPCDGYMLKEIGGHEPPQPKYATVSASIPATQPTDLFDSSI